MRDVALARVTDQSANRRMQDHIIGIAIMWSWRMGGYIFGEEQRNPAYRDDADDSCEADNICKIQKKNVPNLAPHNFKCNKCPNCTLLIQNIGSKILKCLFDVGRWFEQRQWLFNV